FNQSAALSPIHFFLDRCGPNGLRISCAARCALIHMLHCPESTPPRDRDQRNPDPVEQNPPPCLGRQAVRGGAPAPRFEEASDCRAKVDQGPRDSRDRAGHRNDEGYGWTSRPESHDQGTEAAERV